MGWKKGVKLGLIIEKYSSWAKITKLWWVILDLFLK